MKHCCLPDHTSRGNINRASTYLAVQIRRTTSVNPAVPVNTMREFVDYAKKNPGKVYYGSAGNGSTNHFLGELVK